MPGCVRRIGGGAEPGVSSSGPKTGVSKGGRVFSEAQLPGKGSLEFQVQMLTIDDFRQHDELLRRDSLFKHDFIWGDERNEKRRKEVKEIVERVWGEVKKEREVKDKMEEEEENVKRMKMEEKDEEGKRDGGGGNRGRKKKDK